MQKYAIIVKRKVFYMYRIGIGYDIHKLIEGRDLIIGGIKITHEKGFSDIQMRMF